MNRSAVLHIPMLLYAYGIDEKHVMIRLRVGRGDLKACRLYYGGSGLRTDTATVGSGYCDL